MEKEVSSTTQDPSGAVKGRKKFYITTAIMYTNGLPHIGHVYEVIGADVLARYHRVCGSDVFFLTGTDEHGQKVAESAAKESLAPLALCDRIVEAFKGVNQAFGISNDDFIRTTEERHRATCCWLWERAVANGDIYLGNYEGWYNTREEKFVTETEAQASNYTDPTSGKPLTKTSEPSYFFRLSKYQAALLKHIHDHPNFILPAERKQEILARLEEPLIDLSISRTTFDWGIPCPQAEGVEQGKEKHVMYVWFDALTNYLSGVDYDRKGERAQYWPPDVQVVGKDIAWFHTVIWPCMLLSAQIPLPVTVFSHGFVNDKDGRKQSKSIGNIVDPLEVLKDNSADNIRYYLMRDGVYGGDLSYNAENVVTRHDTELCDSLGNLVSRVLNLCKSYSAGCIPDAEPYDPLFNVAELKAKIDEHYRAFQIHAAIEVIFEQFRHINNWLAEKAPWLLKGENVLPEQRRILRTALEATFILCHLIQPVIPDKIATVCQWFGHPLTTLPQLTDFNNLKPGTSVIVGLQLFPKKGETRFVKGQKKAAEGGNNTNNTNNNAANNNNAAPNQNQHAAGKGGKGGGGKGGGGKGGGPVVPEGPLDVRRADLRVGLIRSCKPHRDPTGAHLYEEEIDVGDAKPRSVVSGLAKFIPLDEMQNRLCVVVCNMKPSTFKGVLSEAMVLCANSDDHSVVQLIEPPPGSKVGERLACEGFNTHTDPFPPQFNPKKKEFEAIKPDLKTDEKGVACYKGVPLVTSVGPCTAKSLNNAALG